MSLVYIGSTGDHAGQSLITWTIARRLREKGINPGFFKPFGTGNVCVNGAWTDPDAFLFREFLNIQEPLELICPFSDSESIAENHSPKEVFDRIKILTDQFLAGRDLLLVMGSRHIFFDDALCSISDISIISEFNADLVLIHRYRKVSATLYTILSVHSLLKDKVKGIIINRVPPDKIEEVKRLVIPVLNEKGIFNISFIPEDPGLGFRRLGEICSILEGRVAFGEDLLGNAVERTSVGSTQLSGDLLIFKRVYNKIILLGPQNASAIAGIIMTSGKEPGGQVLNAVKKSNIPLILIKQNSLEALERLEDAMPSLSPEDEGKVMRCAEILDRIGFLNTLIDSFKIRLVR